MRKYEKKQLNFNLQTNEIAHKKIRTWLRKGNFKRET